MESFNNYSHDLCLNFQSLSLAQALTSSATCSSSILKSPGPEVCMKFPHSHRNKIISVANKSVPLICVCAINQRKSRQRQKDKKNILRRLEVLLQKNAKIKMFLSGKDYGKGSSNEASFDDVIGWESASLIDRCPIQTTLLNLTSFT